MRTTLFFVFFASAYLLAIPLQSSTQAVLSPQEISHQAHARHMSDKNEQMHSDCATSLRTKPTLSEKKLLTQNTFNELDGQQLIKNLNRTKTSHGKTMLASLLTPTSDLELINQRKAFLQEIVSNEELYTYLLDAVEAVASSEESLLRYIKSQHKQGTQELFFRLPFNLFHDKIDQLNYREAPLNFAFYCKLITTLTSLGFSNFTAHAVPELFHAYTAWQAPRMRSMIYNTCFSFVNKYLPWEVLYAKNKNPHEIMFANLANLYTASMKDIYLHARNFIHDDLYTGSIAATTWACVGTWITMKNLEHIKKALDEYVSKTQYVHSELVDVAATINTTQELITHLNAIDAAPKDDICTLTRTYSKSSESRFNQLIDNLASSTFSESTNMYSRGRVLATHRMLTEEKEKLAPLLEVIGLVDAYVSLAEIYMEQKDTRAPYCFAEIVETDTPYINVSDCWCPLISPEKAVANSLRLGSTGDNTNAILTGPNALGKTLFMQGISHAVMLAQSVGMVPAASAEISLFHCIKSYLNITQDPTQGLSSFAAEKARVEELTRYMKNHTHAGPYLFVLDEPYSKTYAREAENRVYDFGKTVAEHPNCMALLATHLKKPTNLEEDTSGIFKNYHPEVIENNDGTFTPCFKIRPGRPAWWFSDDQKRSKFVDWLATPS